MIRCPVSISVLVFGKSVPALAGKMEWNLYEIDSKTPLKAQSRERERESCILKRFNFFFSCQRRENYYAE